MHKYVANEVPKRMNLPENTQLSVFLGRFRLTSPSFLSRSVEFGHVLTRIARHLCHLVGTFGWFLRQHDHDVDELHH